jgi:hypothetical protein
MRCLVVAYEILICHLDRAFLVANLVPFAFASFHYASAFALRKVSRKIVFPCMLKEYALFELGFEMLEALGQNYLVSLQPQGAWLARARALVYCR